MDKRLVQLAKKMGPKPASILLSVLGKDKQFLGALDSSVGQELIKDAILELEDKFQLVLSEKDSPQVRADIRAYLSIIKKWQKRLQRFNEKTEEFNKYTA